MRKRYTTTPPSFLRNVVEVLEDEDEESARLAVITLVEGGPLLCADVLMQELRRPTEVSTTAMVGNALRAFLRELVELKGSGQEGRGIAIAGPIALHVLTVGATATGVAHGSVRDVAVLQLWLLLQEVGIDSVRACSA